MENSNAVIVEADVKFGRFYSLFLFVAQISLIPAILILCLTDKDVNSHSELLASLGANLVSSPNLIIYLTIVTTSIGLAKWISGHKKSLYLPAAEEYPANYKTQLKKAPFARRTALRVKYFCKRLAPVKTILLNLIVLSSAWAVLAFVVICFGAPVLTHHFETAAFVTLLSIQSVWPLILSTGPDPEKITKTILGDCSLDPLGRLLYQNCWGAFAGAWIGAFPIPLDWDRPWQEWPITSVLGTFVAVFVTNIVSLYQISKIYSSQKSSRFVFKKSN